jgi:hypothetical protein
LSLEERERALARRFRWAAAACAGVAALMLVVSYALNERALSIEEGLVSDDAFGPLVIGVMLAVAACAIAIRSVLRLNADNAITGVVLSISLSVTAVIAAVLTIGEPAVFNAGYGCLGEAHTVWLAVALRPTPAPCGYLIPSADNPLFHPAAYAAFGAAALGAACAILMLLGRIRSRPQIGVI